MKTTLYLTLTLIAFAVLAFVPNSFAQDNSPEYVVRVIYLIPNDQEPDPDIDSKLDTLMKDAQQFYADQMDAHGFGRKTFRFETDENENVVVHHVNGKFNDAYYQNPATGSWIVWEEIEVQFDMSKNIYFLALGISNNFLNGVATANTSGIGVGSSLSGRGLIPASRFGAAFHELGHAFGLQHDWRADANRIFTRRVKDPMTASFCAAEWLDVHRYFNPNQEPANDNTSVRMLPPSFAEPPATIRLQFEVADPDGLHQAQLFRPFSNVGNDGLYQPYSSWPGVIACQGLSGNRATVEFVTNDLVGGNNVVLRVIDGHGNYTFEGKSFTIDITDLLPPPKAISIPDPNLAAAVRETLGLAPGTPITQMDMLGLVKFSDHDFDYLHAADLTGLQHAIKMRELAFLKGTQISDITPLAGLTNLTWLSLNNSSVSDISAVAGLTNLTGLGLYNNSVSDISAVAGLTNLTELNLGNNHISDISAVAGLTNLTGLGLYNNSVSDISAVAGLTNLTELNLGNNDISDISAVAGLTNLTVLRLGGNDISDISAVAGLTNLTELNLGNNDISDISAVAGLTNLTELNLGNNDISDISAVAGLTNLTELNLGNNHISDISAVAGLTNLTVLRLGGNDISDISAVAGLTNLTGTSWDSTGLHLERNPLSYQSIHTHIPALQERGVEVNFDTRTPHRIRIVTGNNQQGLPGAALEKPFVVEVRDGSSVAFAGVPVTFTITAGGGTLSTQTTTTDPNGRAESILTLGPNPGTNTVTVSVTGSQETRTFNAEGSRIPKKLEIISGVDQEGLPGDVLEKPFVVEVRDQTDKPLPGVEVTFTVTAGGGTLSATHATTDENGRAESTLTLGSTPGANTVRVSVEGNTQAVAFLTIEAARTPMFTLAIPAGTHANPYPVGC